MNNNCYLNNAELLKKYRAGDINARDDLIMTNSGVGYEDRTKVLL